MTESKQEILKGIDDTIAKYKENLTTLAPEDSEGLKTILRFLIADLTHVKNCMLGIEQRGGG